MPCKVKILINLTMYFRVRNRTGSWNSWGGWKNSKKLINGGGGGGVELPRGWNFRRIYFKEQADIFNNKRT